MSRMVPLVVLALLVAVPAEALADTSVSRSASGLFVTDDSPAGNDLTIDATGSTLTITEAAGGQQLVPGTNCSGGPTTVTCAGPLTGSQIVQVSLADGTVDQRVTVASTVRAFAFGGSGRDLIATGDGSDQLMGHGGDDVLRGGGNLDALYGDGDPTDPAEDAETGADDLDGQDGPDRLDGGPGGDVFADSGSARVDAVSYFDGTDNPEGVVVSLDGVANDGNAAEDGSLDNVQPSIATVQGSRFGDDLAGGPGDDFLSGAPGDDVLIGNGGSDRFNGADDNDVIEARDGVVDGPEINCDNSMGALGTSDTAFLDAVDPEPANCETVTRTSGGGGGGGGGSGGDGGGGGGQTGGGGGGGGGEASPLPGPSPLPVVEPVCLLAPLRGCVPGVDTIRRVVFPDLRGRDAVDARQLLAQAGIEVDERRLDIRRDRRRRDRLPAHPGGGRWAENMLIEQSVAPGERILAGANIRVALSYTVWDGPDRETCAQSGRDNAGTDFAAWKETMAEYGCKVDDVLVRIRESTRQGGEVDLNSGDRCEVVKSTAAAGKRIDATLVVPDDPAETDLRLGFTETYVTPSFIAGSRDETWTLPVAREGAKSGMVVSVHDRSGAPVSGVRVFVDATAVGAGTPEFTTSSTQAAGRTDQGARLLSLAPVREGRIRLVAVATDRTGNSLCGAAEVGVTDPGKSFTSISGNAWKRSDGAWKRTDADAAGAARARAAQGGWFNDLMAGIAKFFGFEPEVKATVASKRPAKARAKKVFATHGGTVMQMSSGRVLSGSPALATTRSVADGLVLSPDGRRLGVATGRVIPDGNAMFGKSRDGDTLADPSGLIGPDGASLIGPDGATLIGPDGATLKPDGTPLIGPDGASLIGPDGASLIGPDGASAIPSPKSMAGALVLSTPAGGLLAQGDRPAFGATGGNLVSAAGGNVVSTGGNG